MMETGLEGAQKGTPLIDGEAVTFVWYGEEAPQLIGDFTDWEWGTPLDLTQAGPGVWVRTLSFPADAYLEYAFWADGERVADPLNPRTAPDGLGHTNHTFSMPGAEQTRLTRRRRGIARGTVTRHVVEEEFLLSGRSRAVRLYRPAADGPCPLLVVLDGQDYRPRGKLVPIVDNLIAQGRIRPLALALVDHGGGARGVEYACSDATLSFLLAHVLPLAEQALPLLDAGEQPGAYGILGASMGGLQALYAGLRAPQIFGHVLSQSGAFAFGEVEPVVFDLVRHGPVRPLRIWMNAGRYEWLLDGNRRLHELLVERGYAVTYREHNGGHNYTAWRNEVWRGLELLFGR